LNFVLFARDSHRVRGVFSVVALLSPVESSIPSDAAKLTTCLYARGMPAARGFFYGLTAHIYPLNAQQIVL
jgi:hypothetical protein